MKHDMTFERSVIETFLSGASITENAKKHKISTASISTLLTKILGQRGYGYLENKLKPIKMGRSSVVRPRLLRMSPEEGQRLLEEQESQSCL